MISQQPQCIVQLLHLAFSFSSSVFFSNTRKAVFSWKSMCWKGLVIACVWEYNVMQRIPNKCHASSDFKQPQKTAPWAQILELKSKKKRHISESTDLRKNHGMQEEDSKDSHQEEHRPQLGGPSLAGWKLTSMSEWCSSNCPAFSCKSFLEGNIVSGFWSQKMQLTLSWMNKVELPAHQQHAEECAEWSKQAM